MKRAEGSSHGKIILMGEHSVVYGAPALAMPFHGTEISVSLRPAGNHSMIISDLYEGEVRTAPPILDNLVSLLNALRHDHEVDHYHFVIKIESTIPIERGMGSSAALSVAFVKAFYNYLDKPLDNDTLLMYVDGAEIITHGQPSGLDARVTGYNRPLYFQRGTVDDVFVFDTPLWLLICDSGVPGNTKIAVQNVKDAYNSKYTSRRQATRQAVANLSSLTEQFKDLLKEDHTQQAAEDYPQQIGKMVNAAQRELRTLHVSSPEIDAGITYLLNHGALGAKLTGGGLGGCYFAVVSSRELAEKLAHALTDKQLITDHWIIPFQSKDSNIDDTF
ncbi:mevalonate kinase [Aerococcus vaginalis]